MPEDYISFLLRFFNEDRKLKEILERIKPPKESLNNFILNILKKYIEDNFPCLFKVKNIDIKLYNTEFGFIIEKKNDSKKFFLGKSFLKMKIGENWQWKDIFKIDDTKCIVSLIKNKNKKIKELYIESINKNQEEKQVIWKNTLEELKSQSEEILLKGGFLKSKTYKIIPEFDVALSYN